MSKSVESSKESGAHDHKNVHEKPEKKSGPHSSGEHEEPLKESGAHSSK
jgi:hypothetical protein